MRTLVAAAEPDDRRPPDIKVSAPVRRPAAGGNTGTAGSVLIDWIGGLVANTRQGH